MEDPETDEVRRVNESIAREVMPGGRVSFPELRLRNN